MERERTWAGNFWWTVPGIAMLNQMNPEMLATHMQFMQDAYDRSSSSSTTSSGCSSDAGM